jgi:cytochrome c oxidase assembly protein subunit 15
MRNLIRCDPAEVLTVGFGMTVAMWAVGYLTHLPGAAAPPSFTFALLLLCLFAGGVVAQRWGSGVASAARAGWLAGVVNLLVLGGLLRDPATGTFPPLTWLWCAACILFCGLISAGGAWAARFARRLPSARVVAAASPSAPDLVRYSVRPGAPFGPDWRAALALVAAAATTLLIAVGGVVTGLQAGLAVPDWPGTYGFNMFLYPLARMTGGIYYEHAHRLFGSLVGLTTLVLAAYLQFFERRAYIRALAGLALAAVIVQGILGGLRVTGHEVLIGSSETARPSLALAVVHGVLAQLFLGLLVVLATVVSRRWQALGEVALPAPDAVLGAAALLTIVLQLVMGALWRHTGRPAALIAHLVGAAFVVGVAGVFALRIWARRDGGGEGLPKPLGAAVLVSLAVQVGLGFAALLSTLEGGESACGPFRVLATTAHQTFGAILLAVTTGLLLWHSETRAVRSAVLRPARTGA